MFKREIWDKFTEFTFLKFWNLNIWDFKLSNNERGQFSPNFTIKHVILVNHMWQALKEHAGVRITQKTINQYQQIW